MRKHFFQCFVIMDEVITMIATELVRWYSENKRELPFRGSKDPYSVWVSEIMAQQTRIDTMLPYYLRWMEKFPDVHACASASEAEILKAWEGLGYYRRARMLWKGSKMIVDEFDGIFPSDYANVIKIPGIGEYTAAAILSIAFDQPIAAVDGNVLRVVSRVLMSPHDIVKDSTKKYVAGVLDEWMVGSEPSDFTQGLMELGALICKPASPECTKCPLKDKCLAYRHGAVNQYPVKSSAKKPANEFYNVHFIMNHDRLLVSTDWSDGLMEGYLRLPQVRDEDERFVTEEILFNLKHIYSHKIWEMTVLRSALAEGVDLPDYYRWISLSEIDSQAWISAHRKILTKILKKSD